MDSSDDNDEEEEESPMETDMTILSAEISANKRLDEKSKNKTVFNDFYLHYESDSDKEDSSESHIESNTSERSECLAREVETSAQTSGQPSPQETPQLVLSTQPDTEELAVESWKPLWTRRRVHTASSRLQQGRGSSQQEED